MTPDNSRQKLFVEGPTDGAVINKLVFLRLGVSTSPSRRRTASSRRRWEMADLSAPSRDSATRSPPGDRSDSASSSTATEERSRIAGPGYAKPSSARISDRPTSHLAKDSASTRPGDVLEHGSCPTTARRRSRVVSREPATKPSAVHLELRGGVRSWGQSSRRAVPGSPQVQSRLSHLACMAKSAGSALWHCARSTDLGSKVSCGRCVRRLARVALRRFIGSSRREEPRIAEAQAGRGARRGMA